ncbi:MAG: hypothetical protein WCO51_08690 [bacterium]
MCYNRLVEPNRPFVYQPNQGRRERRSLRLRPLNVGEIIDEALDLYRKNFKLLLGVIVIPTIPFLLLAALVAPPLIYYFYSLSNTAKAPSPEQILGMMAVFVPLMIIGAVLYWLIDAIQYGASALAISDKYLNEQSSIKSVLGRVWKILFRLAGARLLILAPMTLVFTTATFLMLFFIGLMSETPNADSSVGIALVMMVLFFSGIFLAMIVMLGVYVWFLFVTQIVVIEGRSIVNALARSIILIKGNFWRVLGIYLLLAIAVGIIQQMISYAIMLPATALTGSMGQSNPTVPMIGVVSAYIASAAINLLIMPVISGCITLLYYDLRVRKEGFDLEVLAREMGKKTAPDTQATL